MCWACIDLPTIQTFPEQGYAKLTVWRDLDAV